MNDAQCYQTLPRIDRGMARDLPRRARLIADGGYAARVSLIVPRSIVHNRRQRLAKRRLHSIRIVQVEHSIGFKKFMPLSVQNLGTKGSFFHLSFLRVAFCQTEEKFFCVD